MPDNNDKAAYEIAINGLKAIKKALKNCANKDELHSIIASYSSIDVQKPEVQKYIKNHESKRSELIVLESKIINLLTANRRLYGIYQQDPEVIKSTVTKPIIIDSKLDVDKPQALPKANDVIKVKAVEMTQPTTEHVTTTKIKEEVKPTAEDTAKTNAKEALLKEQAEQMKRLHERQLSEFTNCLKLLEAKRDEFHVRYPQESSDDITKVYGVSCQLLKTLEQCAQSYINGLFDLNQFKTNATQAIRDKRNGILSEHRGFKEILVNFLLAIGTLGVGYAIAALFTHRLAPISINTDSINKLDQVQDTLNELGVGLPTL